MIEQLPSLRTGEGIFLGEVMPIPSRVRIRKAKEKPIGDDPHLPEAWQVTERPDEKLYSIGLKNWRAQSLLGKVIDKNVEQLEGESDA